MERNTRGKCINVSYGNFISNRRKGFILSGFFWLDTYFDGEFKSPCSVNIRLKATKMAGYSSVSALTAECIGK